MGSSKPTHTSDPNQPSNEEQHNWEELDIDRRGKFLDEKVAETIITHLAII